MRQFIRLFSFVVAFALAASAQDLHMNQIQVIATHNSYHIAKEKPLMPDLAYSHPPLNEQLDNGVRGFELDVYLQPEGHFKVFARAEVRRAVDVRTGSRIASR